LLECKINIAYSEYVFVALGIHRIMRVRHISVCSLSGSTKFSALSHKQRDFRKKKKFLNIQCVFWFSLQLLPETLLILRRSERDMIKKCVLVFM